jgi:hypothetical protein
MGFAGSSCELSASSFTQSESQTGTVADPILIYYLIKYQELRTELKFSVKRA